MINRETIELAKVLGMTETELRQEVNDFKNGETKIIKNRAVAMALGLTDD